MTTDKGAWQSFSERRGIARRAVDGHHDAMRQGSCTRTNKQDNPWWTVDLKAEYDITQVIITNTGIYCKLNNFGFNYVSCFFTACKRSCEKVMFLHLSVILFTGGLCGGLCPGGGGLCPGEGVSVQEEGLSVEGRGPVGLCPGSLSRGISVPVCTFDTCDIHSLLILYWYYSIVFHTSNMPFDLLLIVQYLAPSTPLTSKSYSIYNVDSTGRERLIRSHSSARFCFELSGNSN